jgi:phosphoribosyl-AMP cyclohydrolase
VVAGEWGYPVGESRSIAQSPAGVWGCGSRLAPVPSPSAHAPSETVREHLPYSWVAHQVGQGQQEAVVIGWRFLWAQGTIAPVHELEESDQLGLDFGKLASVAATGARVVPTVLQDADSGEVLFIGYANEEALEASLRERIAVLWSTSRNELWRKGATSGDVLELAEIRVNCEQNSVLYLVHPATGGACHTVSASGSTRPSCYYRAITDEMTLRPAAAAELLS